MKSSQTVILSSRISDHWKEKAILAYSLLILKNSLKLIIIILLIAAIFFAATFFSEPILNYILTLRGMFEAIIIASIYILVRRKLNE